MARLCTEPGITTGAGASTSKLILEAAHELRITIIIKRGKDIFMLWWFYTKSTILMPDENFVVLMVEIDTLSLSLKKVKKLPLC